MPKDSFHPLLHPSARAPIKAQRQSCALAKIALRIPASFWPDPSVRNSERDLILALVWASVSWQRAQGWHDAHTRFDEWLFVVVLEHDRPNFGAVFETHSTSGHKARNDRTTADVSSRHLGFIPQAGDRPSIRLFDIQSLLSGSSESPRSSEGQ